MDTTRPYGEKTAGLGMLLAGGDTLGLIHSYWMHPAVSFSGREKPDGLSPYSPAHLTVSIARTRDHGGSTALHLLRSLARKRPADRNDGTYVDTGLDLFDEFIESNPLDGYPMELVVEDWNDHCRTRHMGAYELKGADLR